MPRASTATAVRRKIDLIGRAATSDYHATGPAPAAPGRQEDQPSPTSRKLAGLAASQWRRLPLPQQHRTREQHRIHVTHEEGATSYPYNTRGASSPGGHRDNIAHGQVHAAVNNVDLPEKPVDRLRPAVSCIHKNALTLTFVTVLIYSSIASYQLSVLRLFPPAMATESH